MKKICRMSFFFFVLVVILLFTKSCVDAEELIYAHANHQGTVSFLTDEKGFVVSKNFYFPYGQIISNEGDQNTEKGYTGQINDKLQTGLYYYNARYYNPLIANFSQPDFTNDSLNRYMYVKGNPLRLVDPSGLLACEDIGSTALQKLCQSIERFMVGITGSKDSAMNYEDAKWEYYGNRFEDNYNFFGGDLIRGDISVIDLIKYRVIYEGVWIAGTESFFNQPWASKFMYLFLHGNGDDVDLSEQLESYYENNLFAGEEYPTSYDLIENSNKLVAGYLPFLDTPETGGDTFYALGNSYVTIDPQGNNVMNGIFWYNDQPLLGIYIDNPKISLYDVYDWDRDASVDWFLPIIGEVIVSDNIGKILTENNLGTPFNVSAEVQLQGRYFFMTQPGIYDFGFEHERTQFYEKWRSY